MLNFVSKIMPSAIYILSEQLNGGQKKSMDVSIYGSSTIELMKLLDTSTLNNVGNMSKGNNKDLGCSNTVHMTNRVRKQGQK